MSKGRTKRPTGVVLPAIFPPRVQTSINRAKKRGGMAAWSPVRGVAIQVIRQDGPEGHPALRLGVVQGGGWRSLAFILFSYGKLESFRKSLI